MLQQHLYSHRFLDKACLPIVFAYARAATSHMKSLKEGRGGKGGGVLREHLCGRFLLISLYDCCICPRSHVTLKSYKYLSFFSLTLSLLLGCMLSLSPCLPPCFLPSLPLSLSSCICTYIYTHTCMDMYVYIYAFKYT